MPPISLYTDEDDDSFWREHAFIRLRPTTRIGTEPEEIILGNRIWFGSVASQDDIFEGSPPFTADPGSVNLDAITALARRQMPGTPSNEIDRVACRIFEQLSDPNIFKQRTQALIEQCGEIFRSSSILSLFRDPAVQRNWHEYATQGAGYGAVFDFREPWSFQSAPGLDGLWVPFPVSYVPAENPPVIRISAAPVGKEEGFADIKTALLTKSNEWANQREERLFRMGIGPGHVEFPRRSLRAMILGYSSSRDIQDLIVRLSLQRAAPLPVFQAQPAPPSRRLTLRRIA